MLKTASDFENSVAYITKDSNKDFSSDISIQNEIINSDNFNNTLNNISNELDLLYEKTRVLSDIFDYAKEYIQTNIYNCLTESNSILKSVEYNRDKLRNNSYIYYSVNFLESAGSYTDRDNTNLPNADLKDNNIVLSGDILSTFTIKDFYKLYTKNNIKESSSNINDFLNNVPYRTIYLLDKPVSDGISESLRCDLNSESTINDISIVTSNCSIDSISYIHNDSVEIDTNIKTSIKKEITINSIDIKLSSNNYNIIKQDDGSVKYSYSLGIDSINISKKNINKTVCHISQPIDLGSVDSSTFIQLSADFFCNNNSSIEFYIIDSGKEYPIVPLENTIVNQEKIFYGLDTRFSINKNYSYTVMKDKNVVTNINTDKLSDLNGDYTISYTPEDSYNHYPSSNIIYIKSILRLYDTSDTSPYIERMEIRKYGGDILWQATT